MARRKILLFAEGVTLAHVTRLITLGGGLDSSQTEVFFAVDPRYAGFAQAVPWTVLDVYSIDRQRFLAALAAGRPVYDAATLRSYVQDDLRLLEAIRPDFVVGDFRLSLSISARLAGVPYATVTNAYWSPYAHQRFPIPRHPLVKLLGLYLAQRMFDLIRPLAFHHHSRPINQIRKEHGLPSLGGDLRKVYTDADFVFFADIPELAPTYGAPSNHRYLGPVLWSPQVDLPAWWYTLPADVPLIYVTPGSSGRAGQLAAVLEALAELDCVVIAATAGRESISNPPRNAYVTDFFPGAQAVERAALVICNGGSPASYQALAAGVPVLGIADNMDQLLNMQGVTASGAGSLVRADQFSIPILRARVSDMLAHSGYRNAAQRVASILASYSAPQRFAASVDDFLGPT